MSAQAAILNSLHADRERASEDASLGDSCKAIIEECRERCAFLLRNCENNRAYKSLELLEEAQGEAGAMYRENVA